MWQTLISLCLALSGKAPSRRAPRRRPAFCRPVLEALEDRTVPSAYKVVTTADVLTGNPTQGSLRDAITFIKNDVNLDGSSKLSYTGSDPTRDEIDFNITAASDTGGGYNATTGVATITPLSALPNITNTVLINGYTEGYNPDGTPTPLAARQNTLLGPCALGSTDSTLHPKNYGDNAVLKVELDGENAGTAAGLSLGAGNITVQGLAINRFAADGIDVGGNGDVIQGNFLGTDVTGTQALGNHGNDVYATYTLNVTIGGPTPAARNIISGALPATSGPYVYGDGIFIIGDNGHAVVQGNFIGTDVTGRIALGNTNNGIDTQDEHDLIGGPTAGAGNLISGNGGDGILVQDGYNVLQGNFIGTDVTGTRALGNGGDGGIFIASSPITVGGTTAGAGNLISGNNTGIRIEGVSNVVQGNFIGTDVTGKKAVANGIGVYLPLPAGSNNNLIGGPDTNAPGDPLAGAGNLISGNRDGITLGGSGNTVEGNYIGTDISGMTAIGSAPYGAGVGIGGSGNTIGGTAAACRNIISGNPSTGVAVSGTGDSILGNSIHDNGGGIVLAPGANDNQAAPLLTAAVITPGSTTVTGTLASVANTTFRIEFFANTGLDKSGNAEGLTYLGSAQVTTDASGNASFAAAGLAALPAGQGYLTATATNQNTNDTSEFAQQQLARNNAPGAYAGGSYVVTYGDSLMLDASASSDPDGDALSYAWTINGQANAATGVQPTLSWASLASLGLVPGNSYAVSVTVSDGHRYSVTSTNTTVTVNKATPIFSVVGTTVITDGTSSLTLTGTLSYNGLIPTGNVVVTLDGLPPQTVPIGANGSFSATFATGSLSVGAHTVSFSYGGDTNFTAASASGTLDDTYGVLALFNQGKAKHAGSTLPIQLELASAGGQDVSSGSVNVTALGIAATTDTTDTVGAVALSASQVQSLTPAQAAGGSSPGNVFRFQSGRTPFYAYNLAIPSGLAAGTYRLYFSITGDPLDHWVTFVVD